MPPFPKEFDPAEMMARMNLGVDSRLVGSDASHVPTIQVIPPQESRQPMSSKPSGSLLPSFMDCGGPPRLSQISAYPGSSSSPFDFNRRATDARQRYEACLDLMPGFSAGTPPVQSSARRIADVYTSMAAVFTSAANDAYLRNPSGPPHTAENPNWALAPNEVDENNHKGLVKKRGRSVEREDDEHRGRPSSLLGSILLATDALSNHSAPRGNLHGVHDEPENKRRKQEDSSQCRSASVRSDSRTPDSSRRPRLNVRVIENHLRLNSQDRDRSSSRSRSITPIQNRSPLATAHQVNVPSRRVPLDHVPARSRQPKATRRAPRNLPRVPGRGRPFQADPYAVFNPEFQPMEVFQQFPPSGFPRMHSMAGVCSERQSAAPTRLGNPYDPYVGSATQAAMNNHCGNFLGSPFSPGAPNLVMFSQRSTQKQSAEFSGHMPPIPQNHFNVLAPRSSAQDTSIKPAWHLSDFPTHETLDTRRPLDASFTFRPQSSSAGPRPHSEPHWIDHSKIPRNTNLTVEEYMQLLHIATTGHDQAEKPKVPQIRALQKLDEFGNIISHPSACMPPPQSALLAPASLTNRRPSSAPDSDKTRVARHSGGSLVQRQPIGPSSTAGFIDRENIGKKEGLSFAELLRNRHEIRPGRPQ